MSSVHAEQPPRGAWISSSITPGGVDPLESPRAEVPVATEVAFGSDDVSGRPSAMPDGPPACSASRPRSQASVIVNIRRHRLVCVSSGARVSRWAAIGLIVAGARRAAMSPAFFPAAAKVVEQGRNSPLSPAARSWPRTPALRSPHRSRQVWRPRQRSGHQAGRNARQDRRSALQTSLARPSH